jgi:hypothetical protein
MRRFTLLNIFFILIFFGSMSFGQILTENFDYPVGDSLVNLGWANHSGSGYQLLVTAGNLGYSRYANSGIGNSTTILGGSGSREDANRTFTSVDTTGSYYCSVLVKVDTASATGDYFLDLSENPHTSNYRGRIYVQDDGAGGFNFGVAKQGSPNYTTTSYTYGTTYLLVLKYEYVGSMASDDVVSLFINPDLSQPEPTADLVNSDVATDIQVGAVDLRQGSNVYTVQVDGLEFNNAFPSALGTDVSVTFRVNMSVQILLGNFKVGTDTVEARGSFQAAAGDPGGDWQGFYFTMTKGATDSIYSATATFPDSLIGSTYEYKIVINGGGWESSSNRPFTVPGSDIELPVVFYNNLDKYAPEIKNIVKFQVDMSSYLGTDPGKFDPSKDSLVVMGLSNWGGYGVTRLTGNRTLRPGLGDPTIYSTTLTFYGPAGDSTAWKIKAYPDENFGNGGGYELGDNRWYYFVSDTVTTNVLAPVVPQLIIYAGNIAEAVNVLFQVKMDNAVDFHSKATIAPSAITFVGIKGGIPPLGNWGGNWTFADTVDAPTYADTISTLKTLNDSGLNGDKVAGDNIWSLEFTMPAGTPAGTFEYKYAMGYAGVENENSGSQYLDNEMGFGVNHSLLLSDGPAVEVLNQFGVQAPITGVERDNNVTPVTYSLNQNYPNPFNPSTVIKYSVPSAQFVTLKIYNLLGQEVVTLVNQEQVAGNYNVTFDAKGLSSGIYFYSLQAGSFTSTKKMMLLK